MTDITSVGGVLVNTRVVVAESGKQTNFFYFARAGEKTGDLQIIFILF
jgi:hypothetical protein